jgi:hypothetical protein
VDVPTDIETVTSLKQVRIDTCVSELARLKVIKIAMLPDT